MRVTNNSNISLELAVWLLYDDYDYIDQPNYISATTLLKPLRHILLPPRIPQDQRIIPDVEDYISRAIGSSLHAAIEKAWKEGHRESLKRLGYPDQIIDRILINPTPEELAEAQDPIPIYLEQRAFREFKGYTIGGKFDMVGEGIVNDTKSTTAYSWLRGTRDEEYRLQGSIYRWLNPDKITEDFIRVNFIFTDWQKYMATANPNYPQKRLLQKDIPLLSLEETEAWIERKLALIDRYKDAPESDIPECTEEELWMTDPEYKYYSNPEKTSGRSTKNFKDLGEARKFMAQKGRGTIITVPGTPNRCNYCNAFPICSQKDKYFND